MAIAFRSEKSGDRFFCALQVGFGEGFVGKFMTTKIGKNRHATMKRCNVANGPSATLHGATLQKQLAAFLDTNCAGNSIVCEALFNGSEFLQRCKCNVA